MHKTNSHNNNRLNNIIPISIGHLTKQINNISPIKTKAIAHKGIEVVVIKEEIGLGFHHIKDNIEV